MVRAITENSRRPFDVPITIRLTDTGGQHPRFKQSVIPLNIKEKSLMDNPLILDIDNPDDEDLIFVLNDYDLIFEVNDKYGVLSVRVSHILLILISFVSIKENNFKHDTLEAFRRHSVSANKFASH